MKSSEFYFGIYDYIVFASVLGISSGIGLYYRFSGGKQKTFKEYMLADQTMSIVPVAFSLMASFMSAVTLLGVSNENYLFGTQFVLINISYIIATPIVCYLYLPVFYRLQKISVYEYLEMRFGNITRLFASIAFSLQMTLYMGIVLYAPALALAAVTGISQTWSIIAVGVVCTFYSSLGGMKAVLITDVFQSLLMFAAIFSVIGQGISDFGIKDIFTYAMEGDRLEFFSLSLDPRVRHTVWSLAIGGVFTYCSLYGVNQAQVQRLLTVRSLSKARSSLWLQWIILMLLSLSTSFSGLVLYAQYKKCDPKLAGIITNRDQMLPLYVVDRLGRIPGIAGLFVSGIFSGSLSTVSSALNSLSAVTLYDFILPICPKLVQNGESKATTLSKIVAVLYGFLCIGIAFLVQFLGTGVLQASLTIFGAVGGPLLALFTMGMLCRCVNQKGALCGLISGLMITLWIGFGQPKPPLPIKSLSTEACQSFNGSLPFYDDGIYNESFDNTTTMLLTNVNEISIIASTTPLPQSDDEAFSPIKELYAISYMWVAALGFIVTFSFGNIVGLVTGGRRQNVNKYLLSQFIWNKTEKADVTNPLCFAKAEASSNVEVKMDSPNSHDFTSRL